MNKKQQQFKDLQRNAAAAVMIIMQVNERLALYPGLNEILHCNTAMPGKTGIDLMTIISPGNK